MIEKQIGSIEANRSSQNFWGKKHSFWKEQRHIVETSQSIKIDEQNAWVCDVMFFKNKVLNPIFPKLRFSSIKIVLHNTQSICKFGWSDQRHTQLHVQCLAKSNLCSVYN